MWNVECPPPPRGIPSCPFPFPNTHPDKPPRREGREEDLLTGGVVRGCSHPNRRFTFGPRRSIVNGQGCPLESKELPGVPSA